MALPGSGAISASMIRTELNVPSQVPFSVNSAELAQYTDLNALSISSSLNATTFLVAPASMSEWRNYNHSLTKNITKFSGLRVPYGTPYSTFAQVDVGTNVGLVYVSGSNFFKYGIAPSASIDYTLYYTTYSLDINTKGKFIQKGKFNSTTPIATFKHNYNATSGSVVTFVFRDISGVWTNKSPLNNCRCNLAGVGTANAALAVGGFGWQTPLAPGNYTWLSKTEKFDGSTWSSANDINFAREALAGAGTQNSAVVMGGYSPSLGITSGTEKYNGTTWNGGTAMITGRCTLMGMGTQNAALAVGGAKSDCYVSYCAECYDGTTWTAGTGLVIGSYKYCINGGVGIGTQNSAMVVGGQVKRKKDLSIGFKAYDFWGGTETYDGTTWSLSASSLFFGFGASGAGLRCLSGGGTVNDALVYGGHYCVSTSNIIISSLYVSYTEKWNGITWSVDKSMNNNKRQAAGAAACSAVALSFGGENSTGALSCTECYTA